MNYLEVKKELKKEFEDFLKPLGYKSKSENQGCDFSLMKQNQILRIGYGITNYIDEFETGCYLRISIIPIQNIEGKLFDDPGVYDTIGTGTSQYFNELNYNYHIENMKDIKTWGGVVRKFYEEYAIPFFEKYNSVESIDKLFNDNPTEKVIYCDDLAWRIIIGLIAAKLNVNPNYNELRNYYKDEVESKFQGYFMYEKCMKTIDFLDNHSLEELKAIAYNNQ